MHGRWLWMGSLLPFFAAAVGAQLVTQTQPNRPPDYNAVEETFIHTPAGFDKEGRPAIAAGDQTGVVEIDVVDPETNQPSFCRINVVGADGNYYEPAENPLAPWSLARLGNRPGKAPILYYGWFFYSAGQATVKVPSGPVRVEVWKGFEHRPVVLSTQVPAGKTRRVQIPLPRTLPMSAAGYFSGDTHIHLNRANEADDERALDLLAAEDIGIGYILAMNDPRTYTGKMDQQIWPQQRGFGAASVKRRGACTIASGQEYRCGTYGHICLMMHNRLVQENRAVDPNNWPVFGRIGQETRDLGGYSFHAHGGYSQEIYADFVQAATDGVELLQFAEYRGIGLAGWYKILNAGYRFPAIGACDYPYCRALGDSRTYVHSAESRPLDPADWIRGAAAGLSFFTTGPMLLLEVDGQPPGAHLKKEGLGPHRVRVRIRARCEITPIARVELIVNGQVRNQMTVPREAGLGNWLELEDAIDLDRSSWVAARAYAAGPTSKAAAEAHTNPVYVYVGGKAPYNEADLAWLTARLDDQIAAVNKRQFAEKPDVLEYFQQSKVQLLKVRESGGQRAP